MYVVVEINGHQWLVTQGDQITVDHIESQEGDQVEFDTILCSFDDNGESVHVGEPYLTGKITATVMNQQLGDKVKVVKFQSKKRYHRNKGFRPMQTILSIDSISLNVK